MGFLLRVVATWLLVQAQVARQAPKLENQTLLLAGLDVLYCRNGSALPPAERCSSATQRPTSCGLTDTLMLISTNQVRSVQVLGVPSGSFTTSKPFCEAAYICGAGTVSALTCNSNRQTQMRRNIRHLL